MAICKSLVLLAHIYSSHYDTNLNYNDQTPGVGVECRNGGYSLGAGYYNNSFDDPSFYVAASLNAIDRRWYAISALVGVANGYGETRTLRGCLEDGRCGEGTFTPSSDYVPLVGIRGVLKLGRAELSALWTPHFNDLNPGVLSFAAGWRFGQ